MEPFSVASGEADSPLFRSETPSPTSRPVGQDNRCRGFRFDPKYARLTSSTEIIDPVRQSAHVVEHLQTLKLANIRELPNAPKQEDRRTPVDGDHCGKTDNKARRKEIHDTFSNKPSWR